MSDAITETLGSHISVESDTTQAHLFTRSVNTGTSDG